MIALIDYSTALKKQSDSHYDCLGDVQLTAQVQQAWINGLLIKNLETKIINKQLANKTRGFRKVKIGIFRAS
jgi:hypothetical protein